MDRLRGKIALVTGAASGIGAAIAALEGAALLPPIRVNAVHPGSVETPLLETRLGQRPDLRARLEAQTPLSRLARPDEIALAVTYLASGEASYLTGSSLTVDGGFLAQ